MTGKSTISGRDTYVLDPDEISQLDALSLTSVMRQVPNPEADGRVPTTAQAAAVSDDNTINELLRDPVVTTSPVSDRRQSKPAELEPFEATEDLIAPEILLSEDMEDDDRNS